MNRTTTAAMMATAAVALAACGIGAAAGSSASPPPGGRPGFGRNGATGELVQVKGTTLVVSAPTGDVTVVYTSATTFQKTSTGAFGDIAPGKCIVATGQKDATGTVIATAVRISDPLNSTCTLGGGPGGGRPGGGPGDGTLPSPRPSPPAGRPNFSLVGGQVTAVSGTTVTVQPVNGSPQTVSIPTTVRVTRSAGASASDLAVHECVNVAGAKDSSGNVTARAITIVPAGPSGCASARGGFGGGFGGGGRGGAPGGGPPPGGPPD